MKNSSNHYMQFNLKNVYKRNYNSKIADLITTLYLYITR